MMAIGSAVACGYDDEGQCIILPLTEGVRYKQASAGGYHSVLLRSDGSAVACGSNDHGQCTIPEGMSYKQVSAGCAHSALLQNDRSAVACGCNNCGNCNIPSLNQEEVYYTQVSAGGNHAVLLLRSDGSAVACRLILKPPATSFCKPMSLSRMIQLC